MAHVLVDDLTDERIADGEGGPVELSLDGEAYSLDLSNASRVKLREILAPYFAAGRPVAKPGRRPTGAAESTDGPTDAEIRAWAKSVHMEVGAIGRVKDSVRAAYMRAHSPTAQLAAEPAAKRPPKSGAEPPAAEPVVKPSGPPVAKPAAAPAPPPAKMAAPPAAEPAVEWTEQQRETAEDLIERKVPLATIAEQTRLPYDLIRRWKREMT